MTEFLPSDKSPGSTIPEWLSALASRARQADGQPPFSDQSLVDLRTGDRELIALDHDAAALLSPGEAEFVVDPAARGRGLGTAMLEGLLAGSPGELLIWAHGDHPAARALARSHGLEAVRELLHLRLDLEPAPSTANVTNTHAPTHTHTHTHAEGDVDIEGDADIDTFRVGEDESAWLALNARAFAHHPEQGRLTRADLDELLDEEWFSAQNFLVARSGGDIVGYCWLKVDDAGGEFYVVGIDPEMQGKGLGRRLTEAGLNRLRALDIHRAHLYVEGDSLAAVSLYRSLGFVDDSVDIQYRALAR